MGAGKTATALTAAQELIQDGEIKHALVMAPKRVATLVWPAEIALWEHTLGLRYQVLNGTPGKRAAGLAEAGSRDMTVIGIDHTQWLCEQLETLPDEHPIFDLLIIDESSRFRNPKSKRAKALIRQAKRFRSIWAMTGTPRPNGLEDLFKQLAIVTREKIWGRSFYQWRDMRFYPTDFERRKWAIKPDWEARTVKEAGAYMSTLAPEDMPSLPEINVVEHYLTLPPDAQEIYDQMERELFAELGSEAVYAASAGVASGKLAQLAQGFMYGNAGENGDKTTTTLHNEKRDWIEEFVEDLAGDPCIIVYEFIEDLAVLERLFGPKLPFIGSGVSDKVAAKHVADWNARKLPILAMHAASGGHGLNLQAGGNQMIWYGLTWSPELYEQTIKRIHRPGQAQRCFVHICLAAETVDEMKRLRVVEKMSAQDAFTRYSLSKV
jgi:SNF2 family DNA or RNA helicase